MPLVAALAAGAVAGAVSSDSFVTLMAAVLGGGVATAYAAWRKAGPEAESIGVTTLRGVLEEMRTELERKDKAIADLNRVKGEQSREIHELRLRVEKLELGSEPPPHLA